MVQPGKPPADPPALESGERLSRTVAAAFRGPSFAGMTRHYIEFAQATLVAPPDVREEARAQLQELVEGLGAIPAVSVFWNSLRASRLCLKVRDWSFLYSFDGEALRVSEVRASSR